MVDLSQRVVLRAIAVVLFAAILVLLFVVSDPVRAAALLFVIPIALLALSDGLRGGVGAAITATILLATWTGIEDVDLTALGWVSRLIAFFVLGGLVGRFEDLARRYERRRIDEHYAAELHDRVVQSLVLARYQLDEGHEARAAVESALAGAKTIISDRLGEVEPGELRLEPRE